MTGERDETWRRDAACRNHPTELFFPSTRGRLRTSRRLVSVGQLQEVAALDVCATCPVREECLEYALDRDEVGVWGGTTDRDRRRIRKARAAAGRRGSGRPETGLLPRATAWSDGRAEYVEPCGTEAAYRRHLRRDEEPCVYCRDAQARAVQSRSVSRRDRKAPA